jgi:hypothetical protein
VHTDNRHRPLHEFCHGEQARRFHYHSFSMDPLGLNGSKLETLAREPPDNAATAAHPFDMSVMGGEL